MNTIQTGIRMDESLLKRLKRHARQEKRSLNNYIVNILERETAPKMPKLDIRDFPVDEEIKTLGIVISDIPQDMINNNKRLSKYLGQ